MIDIDIRTLFLLVSVFNFTILLFLIIYILLYKIKNPVLNIFTIGVAFATIAELFFALRNEIPDFYSVDLANTFYFFSFFYILYSIVFALEKYKRKHFLQLHSIPVTLSILFLCFSSSAENMRIVIASINFLLMHIGAAIYLLFTAKKTKLQRFSGYLCIVMSLVILLRIAFSLVDTSVIMFTSNWIQAIIFVINIVFSVAWAIIFLLILKHQADNKLSASEERFRTIFEQVAVGVVLADWDTGTFLKVNQKYQEITGYTEEELFELSFKDITHSDDLRLNLEKLELLKSGKISNYTIEKRYIRKNSSFIWVKLNVSPMLNRRTQSKQLVGVVEDISDQKRAESALNESLAFNEILINTTPDIIYVYDIIENKNLYSSDGLERILGYSNEEIQEMGESFISELIHPDDYKLYINDILERYRDAKEGEVVEHEFRMKRKDGGWCWLLAKESIFHRLEDGRPKHILGIAGDITKRKQTEKTLKESENFLYRTGEMANIGGWHLDLVANKLKWTKTTCRIHEVPEDYVPNLEEAINFYHPDDRDVVNQSVELAIQNNKPYDIQTRLITAKGNLRWVRSMGEATFENNQCVSLSGVFQDITDRREVEEDLKKANATKDKFFAILAHDLINPFNAILGFSSLLNEEFYNLSDNERMQCIADISKATNATFALLKNLLTWGRAIQNQIELHSEVFNLRLLIDQSIDPYSANAKKKSITVLNEIDENISIQVDKYTFCIVIGNLLNNAIKFTPEKGEVSITAQVKDDKTEICIKDTGVGISKEDLDKLFRADSFHTTYGTNYEKGTGLGLLLCKELVEKNGGEIRAESEKDKGSIFIITL